MRSILLEAYRAAMVGPPDPVDAWAAVVGNEHTRRAYQEREARGGVRSSWAEVNEMIAAAHPHGQGAGPDRIFGFSRSPRCPWPRTRQAADSSVSWAGVLSFYDWYCGSPGGIATGLRGPDRRARNRRTGGTPVT